MLCRRCGMDSAATDVCEWCKKPMLPTGGTISKRAAAETGKGDPGPPPTEEATEAHPPAEQMLGTAEPEPVAEPPEEEPAAAAPPSEHVLRPLGALGGEPEAPPMATPQHRAGPTHGLGADATQTSVDVSQYVGQDQSIFRPIERESDETGVQGGRDYLADKRKHKVEEHDPSSEISENVRLARAMAAGVIVCIVVSLLQLAVTRQIPGMLQLIAWPIPLGDSDTFLTAIKYGVVTGLFFGFGLGALLVRFQKGAFLGMIAGLFVGSGLGNPPFSQIAGAICGIVIGRIAIAGVRRVINV
jgi:hypothetical protein